MFHCFAFVLKKRPGFSSNVLLVYICWWKTQWFFHLFHLSKKTTRIFIKSATSLSILMKNAMGLSILSFFLKKKHDKDCHQKCYLFIDVDEKRNGFSFFLHSLKNKTTRIFIKSANCLSILMKNVLFLFLHFFCIFCEFWCEFCANTFLID